MRVSAIAVAAGVAQAKDFQWQAGYTNVVGEEGGSDFQSMLYTLVCGDSDNCQFADSDFADALLGYGMGCYTESAASKIYTGKTTYHMGSNGQPYDEVDKACLDTYRAYRCMFLDYHHGDLKQVTSRNENGTAIDGCYHGITFAYHLNHQGEITCGPEYNAGYAQDAWHGCRAAACEIEKGFAYKVLDWLNEPIIFQHDNWMNYNAAFINFGLKAGASRPHAKKAERVPEKAVQELNRVLGMTKREERCCGAYPNRKPYNSVTHECCANSDVQPNGRCGW